MTRRRIAAWLLSLPLMVAGSQVAHVLAYALVYPNLHVRLSETYFATRQPTAPVADEVAADEVASAPRTASHLLNR